MPGCYCFLSKNFKSNDDFIFAFEVGTYAAILNNMQRKRQVRQDNGSLSTNLADYNCNKKQMLLLGTHIEWRVLLPLHTLLLHIHLHPVHVSVLPCSIFEHHQSLVC